MARDRTLPRRTTFLLAFITALALLAAVFLPLWKPLLLGAVVATALAGWEDRLAGRLGGRRSAAALLLVLGVVVLVVAPLAVLTTILVKEVVDAAHRAQELFAARGIDGMIALLPDRVEGYARQLVDRLPGSWAGIARRATAQGAAAAAFLSSAVSRTSEALFDAAMMLVALFFLLVDGRRLVGWLLAVSPLGSERTGRILGDLGRSSTSVLTSMIATALVQAAVSTLGYWIARVPQPLVFGLLTFFAAFIPSVGTSIVALPIAGVLLVSGHLAAGIFLAAWGLLVTGTIDNVLKPVLARGGVELHGGIVFFAMIGGILTFGALGLVVGPVAVSLLVALVHAGWSDRPALRDDGGAVQRELTAARAESPGAARQDA